MGESWLVIFTIKVVTSTDYEVHVVSVAGPGEAALEKAKEFIANLFSAEWGNREYWVKSVQCIQNPTIHGDI